MKNQLLKIVTVAIECYFSIFDDFGFEMGG
ncbi:MAG: hypothetical protein K0R75_3242 [Paenibacillaceae bacterium]|jgi:hypothetical protein|nr:hypothetical protein [Paenibacillaceae bacterium]